MATYLGPLTTIFTPPSSCFNTYYRDYSSLDVKILDAPECFPSSFVSSGFYSPGLSCPSGYAGVTNNDGAETSINCCPEQYQFSGPWPGACTTAFTSTTVTVLVTADPSDISGTFLQYYENPTVGPIFASAIQLRFRASDLITTTSTSTSASSTSSSLSTAASSSTLTSSASTGSSSSSSTTTASSENTTNNISASAGLSTGAKIGIGVAIPLVVLGIIAVLLALCIRRRKTRRSQEHYNTELPAPAQYTDRKVVAHEKNHELSGVYEPRREPVELDVRR